MEPLYGVFILLALGAGGVVGYIIRKSTAKRRTESAEVKAEAIVNDAKQKTKESLIEAKDKALQIIEEAKKDEQLRRNEIQDARKRLESREETFDKKLIGLEDQEKGLHDKEAQLAASKAKLQEIRDQQIVKLEKIAQLTMEEAKNVVFENTEERMKDELTARIRKLDQWSTSEIDEKAKTILSSAMERVSSSHATETTTTVVTLPNEEMKGRIIGKEGRNIKAIELVTGTEIIIDDTPDSILVSGFNPIRRQLAKRALDKLILDGRIHPARIEESVEEAKKDLAKEILRAGEESAYEVGVAGLDKKLLQILGRLKYRTSYGQNVLQHSVEVSLISKLLAQELGADVTVCTKGGLLHDIGKAVDHEIQGAHSQLGSEILKKYGLSDEIANICISHHENGGALEDVIVRVADSISGARPGARKDTYENYVQRLQELENVAGQFEGIEKVFAIQAGREVRIFVKPENVNDLEAVKLARDVASKIEDELKYPGEIKVTVIRENRVVEYAR